MLLLFLGGLGDSIGTAITTFTIWLSQSLYSLASGAFEIFLVLADGSVLKSIDYGVVLSNFYLLVSVVMLFIVAFSLLKGMIDPDDKKYGTAAVKKIIINTVTSFILMAVLPTIFTFAFDFQIAMVTDYNPIGSFFGYGDLSGSSVSSSSDRTEAAANQIVSSVFTAFLNVNCDQNQSACATPDGIDNLQKNTYNSEDGTAESDGATSTFTDAINRVNNTGNFSIFSSFGGAVYKDKMTFDFLLSLVGGGLLIYIAVSYCFDMALRLIKLIFYQLIAPIPIFFRIVPEGKLSGTFGEWVKVTLACYLEVFVRLFAFYFVIFLCQSIIAAKVIDTLTAGRGFFINLFTKAFLLMGLVTFMKAAPGLISKVTGIDSGNMKLGIKDKLAAGGGFVAGAMIGGGATAFAKNLTNKWGKADNWKNKDGKVTTGSIAKNLAAGALSIGAGTLSAQARSGYSALNAKSYGDMSKSADSGAKGAVSARDKRASYKASHGGTIRGAMWGHVKDVGRSVGEWAGLDGGDEKLGYYETAAQASNSYNDMSESTYKKKQEYIEQSAKVKALQAAYNVFGTDKLIKEKERIEKQLKTATGEAREKLGEELMKVEYDLHQIESSSEYQEAKANYRKEKAILDQLQVDMAIKKKGVISVAATNLAVNQKSNYSGDAELTEAYTAAIRKSFNLCDANGNFDQSRLETLDADTRSIYDAFLSGGEIDDQHINENNIKMVQDAIDAANISRQEAKNKVERARIKKAGNRSTEKKS